MKALLLSSDLAVAARVSDEARRLGAELAWAPTFEALVARAEAAEAALCVIDLAAPGLDVAAAIAGCKALASRPAVVAFGPHVHEARLAAAKAAGCDAVFSRGQFYGQLREILARWLGLE
jgi:DNA-binding NarL/FixJ family response regulator